MKKKLIKKHGKFYWKHTLDAEDKFYIVMFAFVFAVVIFQFIRFVVEA